MNKPRRVISSLIVAAASLAALSSAQAQDSTSGLIGDLYGAGKSYIGLNAGHDLDLQNLHFFAQHIPNLLEVSIGHALISDAIYLGLENAVQLYKKQLS